MSISYTKFIDNLITLDNEYMERLCSYGDSELNKLHELVFQLPLKENDSSQEEIITHINACINTCIDFYTKHTSSKKNGQDQPSQKVMARNVTCVLNTSIEEYLLSILRDKSAFEQQQIRIAIIQYYETEKKNIGADTIDIMKGLGLYSLLHSDNKICRDVFLRHAEQNPIKMITILLDRIKYAERNEHLKKTLEAFPKQKLFNAMQPILIDAILKNNIAEVNFYFEKYGFLAPHWTNDPEFYNAYRKAYEIFDKTSVKPLFPPSLIQDFIGYLSTMSQIKCKDLSLEKEERPDAWSFSSYAFEDRLGVLSKEEFANFLKYFWVLEIPRNVGGWLKNDTKQPLCDGELGKAIDSYLRSLDKDTAPSPVEWLVKHGEEFFPPLRAFLYIQRADMINAYCRSPSLLLGIMAAQLSLDCFLKTQLDTKVYTQVKQRIFAPDGKLRVMEDIDNIISLSTPLVMALLGYTTAAGLAFQDSTTSPNKDSHPMQIGQSKIKLRADVNVDFFGFIKTTLHELVHYFSAAEFPLDKHEDNYDYRFLFGDPQKTGGLSVYDKNNKILMITHAIDEALTETITMNVIRVFYLKKGTIFSYLEERQVLEAGLKALKKNEKAREIPIRTLYNAAFSTKHFAALRKTSAWKALLSYFHENYKKGYIFNLFKKTPT